MKKLLCKLGFHDLKDVGWVQHPLRFRFKCSRCEQLHDWLW